MESSRNNSHRVPLLHGPGVGLLTIELFRDGSQSPWGFRLKGGADVDGGIPLEVIKVFVGSASDGLLCQGDVILSINNQSTQDISHFEAQHLFKSSGTSARLVVARLANHSTEVENRQIGCQKYDTVHNGYQSPAVVPGVGSDVRLGGVHPPNHHHTPAQQDRQILAAAPAQTFHPGYVQALPPQLPFSRDATVSRPQESETFKMIMRAEMIGAKDQSSIDAKMFDKSQNTRPSSQTSDLSDESRILVDPLLKNTSINQSSTFKKLMHSVLGETEF